MQRRQPRVDIENAQLAPLQMLLHDHLRESRNAGAIPDQPRDRGERVGIDDADRARMATTGASISFCATSNLFLGSGLFDLDAAREAGVTVGIGSDVGGGTALSLLRTLNESYKVLQMRGQRLPALQGFYLITLGGARALALDAHIGNFEPGKEADFVVLDPESTPLRRRRNRVARDFEERLFMLMMLGDDRAVHATYVMGEPAYRATG